MSTSPFHFLLLSLLLAINVGCVLAGGYSLTVRDSIMIAHSFANNPSFGPAQNLHGATYTVDVTFKIPKLHPKNNWVVDIGEASEVLKEVCEAYNFKNLDEMFPGEMTTTEFMCKKIFEGIKKGRGKNWFKGALEIRLSESHKAWASYEGKV
ncbi:hypothetical protein TrST_g2362 [Triparma strigata]|uniref:6-pyruvoyltetrahydropterin synthase n=1 Tax=Triparma strigata TaxID=1606541 RepID=A0A9W6ZNT0_9STRA|nr:hypothetical protein TrST_g2362 [Triparma strigata]